MLDVHAGFGPRGFSTAVGIRTRVDRYLSPESYERIKSHQNKSSPSSEEKIYPLQQRTEMRETAFRAKKIRTKFLMLLQTTS